jgi:hypothetical protein
MHTINFQVEDSVYESIKKQGLDLHAQIKEFVQDLADDGFPAISTDEAKKRVSEAVESYNNGTMQPVSHEDMWKQIDKDIEVKVADSL